MSTSSHQPAFAHWSWTDSGRSPGTDAPIQACPAQRRRKSCRYLRHRISAYSSFFSSKYPMSSKVSSFASLTHTGDGVKQRRSDAGFHGPHVLPNHATPRYTPTPRLHQPEERRVSGAEASSEIRVLAQSPASKRSGPNPFPGTGQISLFKSHLIFTGLQLGGWWAPSSTSNV